MALMQAVSVSFVQLHPSPERLQTAVTGAWGVNVLQQCKRSVQSNPRFIPATSLYHYFISTLFIKSTSAPLLRVMI